MLTGAHSFCQNNCFAVSRKLAKVSDCSYVSFSLHADAQQMRSCARCQRLLSWTTRTQRCRRSPRRRTASGNPSHAITWTRCAALNASDCFYQCGDLLSTVCMYDIIPATTLSWMACSGYATSGALCIWSRRCTRSTTLMRTHQPFRLSSASTTTRRPQRGATRMRKSTCIAS